MDLVPTWLAPSLIAFIGVLVTASVSAIVTLRNERRRVARDSEHRWSPQKRELYATLHAAASELQQLRVWPEDPTEVPEPPSPVVRRVYDAHSSLAFITPGAVLETVTTILAAADNVHTTITHIRKNSTPGYRGQIDSSAVEPYRTAVDTLATAVDTFVRAARHDLDVRSEFTSVRVPSSDVE
jgi:hypothetical protein